MGVGGVGHAEGDNDAVLWQGDIESGRYWLYHKHMLDIPHTVRHFIANITQRGLEPVWQYQPCNTQGLVDPWQGQGLFSSSPLRPNLLWGSWVKRPGREADNSPPSNADVKNAWSYTSITPYIFIALCLIN